MNIFRSGQLYWWRYLEITTDLLKVADNTDQNMESVLKSIIYSSFASNWFSPVFCGFVLLIIYVFSVVFFVVFFFNLSSFCVLWPKLFVSLECPFLIVPFTIPWRLFIVSSTPPQVTLAVSGTNSTGNFIYKWHAIAVNLLLVNKWYELLSFQ